MTTLRYGQTPINLPALFVPVAVAEAYAKAQRVADAKDEAFRARDAAESKLRGMRDGVATTRAQAFAATGSFGDDGETIAEAEVVASNAQSDLSAIAEALEIVIREIPVAVDASAEGWAKTARAEGKKALTKLVTALRMGEEAAATLRDTIGTLNMLGEREAGAGTLAVKQARDSHIFAVDAGLEGVRQGIRQAQRELDAHKKTTGVYVAPDDEATDEPSVAIISKRDETDYS